MKKYNKNRQQFNVQLSDGTNDISFEKMWALNQAKSSPGFIPNPLAKAYTPSFGVGGVLQGLGGIASAIPIPGVAIGGAALSMIGGLLNKPTATNPSVGYANKNPYGMATGGSMEPISPNAMEVTGAPNQTDGNQINYKGQPINVDHGEVIDHSKDIVFSDKLFDPRSGKSFADTVKPMEKLIGKLSKMPSNINNNTIKALEQQKQKVFQTQEQVAAALGQRNSDGSTVQPGQPAMASGGSISDPGDPTLPNKFGGASRQDSIALMNNSQAVMNYYKNKKYETTIGKSYLDSPNILKEALDEDLVSFRARNDKKLTGYPDKNGNFATGKLPESYYSQKVNKYQRKQRESANAILDTRAPMALYDYRVRPSRSVSFDNIDKSDLLYGDFASVYLYDPVSVKPYDLRTKADHEYIKKNYPEQYATQYKNTTTKPINKNTTTKPINKIAKSESDVINPSYKPTRLKKNVKPIVQEAAPVPVNKIDVAQHMFTKNGKTVGITTEAYNKLMSSGKVTEYKTGRVLDKNKYNVKPLEQMSNFKSGGKIKSYVTGGDPGNPQKKYYNLFDRLFGTNTANKFNYIEKGPTRIANSPMSLLMQKNGITGPETTITAKRIKKANIQPPKSRDFSNSNYTSSTQSSKNYATTGTNNFPITSMMQQQNNVKTTPNTVTLKSSRNTVTPKSSRNTIPTRSTSIIPTGNEFQYPKGYEAASRLGLNPEDFYEDADQFLKTPAGKLWEQVQRAEDPNYKGFSKDKKFGKYHTAMYQNPEFQRIASGQVAKEQAAFSQANQKMKEYNPTAAISDLIKKVDKGNTEPINPLKPKLDYLPAIKQRFKPIPKFGVGDYMQLGAAGASVLGALLDRPEKQKPNLDKTQITQNRYDPANALMQNQYTTNAGMMANTNNYSSAGVQAGLQNLMANKYRADSQVQSQYDQMNQQARTQYEQRLQQQNQFNAQTLSANDDKNVANRAAYTNNLYGALQTVSQVGAGLNDKQAMDTYLKLLAQRDPQASAGILNADGELVSEKKWSGGKIKLRKRR